MTSPVDPASSSPTPPASPPASQARTAARSRWRTRSVVVTAATVLAVGLTVGGTVAATRAVTSDLQVSSTAVPGADESSLPEGAAPQAPGGFAFGPGVTPQQAPQQDTSTEVYADATAEQSVGIVQITSTTANGTGAGTGLVLSADGTVVTNHHVVEGASDIEVTVVSTAQTYSATYVGGDATNDVAVLTLDGASGLTPVTLASTATAAGGEVTAVGDAGGDGGSLTASPGTVTATDQQITVEGDDGTSSTLTGLVEVDAYVVPGDSGGAVLDADDDVVGMNVAASMGTGDVTGYAIPIATVQSVVDQILAGDESGTVSLGQHGYLGVALAADVSGVTVAQVVQGEAAAVAGLAAGDTITSFDGTGVTSAEQLSALVAEHDAGDEVAIAWTSADGAAHTATVTLGLAPVS